MKYQVPWIHGTRLPIEFDAARSNIILFIIFASTKANKIWFWWPLETWFRRFIEISGHDLNIFQRSEPWSTELHYSNDQIKGFAIFVKLTCQKPLRPATDKERALQKAWRTVSIVSWKKERQYTRLERFPWTSPKTAHTYWYPQFLLRNQQLGSHHGPFI